MTRKSKREIARKLEDIEDGPPGEYPKLDTIVLLLKHDWEIVDEENSLWERQDTGEIYHHPQEMQDKLEAALSE